MKAGQTISVASAALLLVGGCAHEEDYANQNGSSEPPGGVSAQSSGGTISSSGTSTRTSGRPAVCLSDNTITADVRESLQKDPEIATVLPSIQVNANNGTVVLNGSIQSEGQRQQIKLLVSNTSGVGGIDDQLQVASQGAVLSQADEGEGGRISAGGSSGQVQGAESSGRLMQTSRTNEGSSLYQNAPTNRDLYSEELLNPTSSSNNLTQIYQNATNSMDSSSNGVLNPTSSNGLPRIYREGSNSLNNANSNALNPTSRNAVPSRVYPPGQQPGTEEENTNSTQKP